MSGRRTPGKGAVVGVTVLTAALLAVAVTQVWVSGSADDPVLGHRTVAIDGRAAAPAALGLALAAGAGALAASVVGRWGRIFAGLIVSLCAGAVAVLAFGVARAPAQAVDHAAAESLGRAAGASVSGVTTLPWVWISLLLAAVLAVEGVVVLLAARRWSGLSARYDAPAAKADPSAQSAEKDAETSAPETAAGEAAAGEAAKPLSDADERRRAARASVADWDQLSAGEDPTR